MRDVYGVVVSDDTELPDEAATEVLRDKLRDSRVQLTAVPQGDSYRSGAVSRHRICRLHPSDAESIGGQAESLVELVSGHGAPLRAWLIIDPELEPGSCPIDAHGLAMLGLSVGNHLEVRLIGPPRV